MGSHLGIATCCISGISYVLARSQNGCLCEISSFAINNYEKTKQNPGHMRLHLPHAPSIELGSATDGVDLKRSL
jgi:hypothetical protein